MNNSTENYYTDKTHISNSNIGWFLQKGPAYLHKMLTDPPPEEKNAVLERGSMIHMYILQPEEFQKTYIVWDKSRPSSTQQEKFCQALANTLEIEPNKAILSAYKEAYSTKGKSEFAMLSDARKIASTLKDYIDFLKQNDGRTMISPWDVKMLEKIKQNIQSHKLAWKIINTQGTVYESINSNKKAQWGAHEFHINWEWKKGYTIKCKSLLDGLSLDFEKKIAVIYDLKTTQKLWHFEDSIEQYDYCRQLAFYRMGVQWYLENELGQVPDEWDVYFYIIGIDTTGSYEIRVFDVEQFMVDSRVDTIDRALYYIGWHQYTNKWDHSREYYEGDGSEKLDL